MEDWAMHLDMKQLSRRAAVVLAIVTMLAAAGTAQNLVINGTFDHDITGWNTSNETTLKVLFRSDAGNTLAGGSGPGSLEIQNYFWNGSSGPAHSDPISVEEGATYTFRAAAFIPDSNDNVAQGGLLWVRFYDADDFYLGDGPTLYVTSERGVWKAADTEVIVPSGTASVRIFPAVTNPVLDNETRPGVVYFDDISLVKAGASTSTQVLFVPAAASAHGRNGTFWTTSGWFTNLTATPVEIEAAFLKPGQDNTAAIGSLTRLGTVPANGFLEVDDMVAKVGAAGLSGGLYLVASAPGAGLPAEMVEVTTYTFTPNSGGDGGFGQGVPAVGPGAKGAVVLSGLFQNADYRTNIGAVNTSSSPVTLDVTLRGADGTVAGSATWNLPPYGQKQVSVKDLGVTSITGGSVSFGRTSASGSFQAYTTVVDQKSGDAVYILGR